MRAKQPDSVIDCRRRIGQRIKTARLGCGMSQTEMGRQMARPRTHAAVSELEAGKVGIEAAELVQLANVLHHHVGYFLESV